MKNDIVGAVGSRLAAGQNLLIASHERPDGDAAGSLLGLGLAMHAAGKNVQMVLADGVPSAFRHLAGADQIKESIEPAFDTFITVDCPEYNRTGKVFAALRSPDINIDHHTTNEKSGELNLVEGDEVVTSAILASRLPSWGHRITASVAAALLTGVLTDTLGFGTFNVTPEAMLQVAARIEAGADLPQLHRRQEVGLAANRRIHSTHGQ